MTPSGVILMNSTVLLPIWLGRKKKTAKKIDSICSERLLSCLELPPTDQSYWWVCCSDMCLSCLELPQSCTRAFHSCFEKSLSCVEVLLSGVELF